MAGEPAARASVQAAVMKSAAGAAGQAPASMANQFQTNAVASDLSVMADQAGTYARRTAEGNQEQAANRSAAQGRLAQEAAQAAQERANSLELQRMDLQAAQARAAADAAGTQRSLATTQSTAAADDESARYVARRDAVLGHAARNRDGQFLTDLNAIVQSSGGYNDAVKLLDNQIKNNEITSNAPAMRAYLRQIFRNAAHGKEPDLQALSGKRSPSRPAPNPR